MIQECVCLQEVSRAKGRRQKNIPRRYIINPFAPRSISAALFCTTALLSLAPFTPAFTPPSTRASAAAFLIKARHASFCAEDAPGKRRTYALPAPNEYVKRSGSPFPLNRPRDHASATSCKGSLGVYFGSRLPCTARFWPLCTCRGERAHVIGCYNHMRI